MPNSTDNEYTSSSEKESIVMTITEHEPLGFGNPDAHISIVEKMKDPLQSEYIEKTAEFIKTGEFFVAVDKDDDGCIDGRIATLVTFIKDSQTGFVTEPIADEGHERAKVAGGGYMTALAMYIGAKFNSGSIEEDLAAVTELLTKEGVYCGAHTAGNNGPDAPKCGCGANDDIDKILIAAVTHAAKIRETTEALMSVAGVTIEGNIVAAVEKNLKRSSEDESYVAGSTGTSRFTAIKNGIAEAQTTAGVESPVAVSKDLIGSHQEAFIVLNYKDGTTLSQRQLQEKLAQEYPDADPLELPQAFVVDVWRIVELAKAISDADAEIDFATALQAGVNYQLATAAHLTDGSLKVLISQ